MKARDAFNQCRLPPPTTTGTSALSSRKNQTLSSLHAPQKRRGLHASITLNTSPARSLHSCIKKHDCTRSVCTHSLTHSPAAVTSCISCLQIKTFCALSLIPIQTHPAHTREGLSISLIVSAVLSLAEQRTLNRERLSPTPKSSRRSREP
jgi:hypothetical protein